MGYNNAIVTGALQRPPSEAGRWLRLLITDPRIRNSWLFLFGCAVFEAYYLAHARLSDGTSAFSIKQLCLGSLMAGYFGWSAYWGVPGCWKFVRLIPRKLGCSTLGCGWSFALFLLFACLLVVYPPLGGGAFHFLKRWWSLGGGVSAVAVLQPQVPDPQADTARRLQTLTDLLRKGIITPEEHDRQRDLILKSI